MRAASQLMIALALIPATLGVPRAVRAEGPAPANEPRHGTAVPPDVPIPPVLGLDEALRLLRERGLDLLIADATVRTAEGNAQTAGGIANPQVSFSTGPMLDYNASAPGCSGCSREVINAGVSDNAAIFDSLVGKRGLRIEVARAALAAARLSRGDALRKLELQVKQAYAQVVLQAETLDLDREIQKSLESTLTVSRAQYPRIIDEGGLARIEVQKLEGDQAVSSDIQTLRQAKVALAFLIGARRIAPDFEVDRRTLAFRVPAALATASSDALLRRAVEQRPDVAALGYQRLSAGASFELAKRQQMPDVTLGVQYSSWGTGQNAATPPALSGQISANVPIFYQQQGEIRRARANLATGALQHAKALAQVASDVANAFAAFKANRDLVERMEGRLLERARTARDIVERQYRGGNLKLTDFLDAQRTYIATREEYLNDLAAYWTAIFQLEAAVNVELRR
jgi:outer membrane protein, heavy metal efflux system